MTEIKSLRTYNTKIFGNESSPRVVHVSAGHFHYYNKLGVGDGVSGFREIDNTLAWNDAKKGWEFQFHNYQPFIPEFADEQFSYRDLFQGKDQTIQFRPVAAHIQGQLVPSIEGLTSANAIIYADAFGAGIDLIIAFTHKKMQKIVRIRDGFKPAIDASFDFEFTYPTTDVFAATAKEIIGAKLNLLDADLTSETIFIGTDKTDGSDWYTRIAPARAWDSGKAGEGTGMKCEFAPVKILTAGGKAIYRKTIAAAFFSGSTGDVFTDATFSYTETKDTYYGTVFTTGGSPDSEQLAIGGWGDNYYPFVEWDLTNTPSSNDTFRAVIRFSIVGIATNDSASLLQRVTQSWTEAGVTSTNNPTWTSTGQVSFPNLANYNNLEGLNPAIVLDWTQMYKDWKDGVNSNFGIRIGGTTNPTDAQHNLASSDNVNANLQPLLIISYPPKTGQNDRIRPRAFAPALAR